MIEMKWDRMCLECNTRQSSVYHMNPWLHATHSHDCSMTHCILFHGCVLIMNSVLTCIVWYTRLDNTSLFKRCKVIKQLSQVYCALRKCWSSVNSSTRNNAKFIYYHSALSSPSIYTIIVLLVSLHVSTTILVVTTQSSTKGRSDDTPPPVR